MPPYADKVRTDGQTNEQTNERMDIQFDFIIPQILFGGINNIKCLMWNFQRQAKDR